VRHRLYYLLPDVAAARSAMDELLLARIEARHIRFMSAGQNLPPELPEASLMQRTDIVRGAEMGMAAGALLGLLAGIGLLYYFDLDRAGVKAAVVVIASLVGLLFGAWASSMQGASLPNSRLSAFAPELASTQPQRPYVRQRGASEAQRSAPRALRFHKSLLVAGRHALGIDVRNAKRKYAAATLAFGVSQYSALRYGEAL